MIVKIQLLNGRTQKVHPSSIRWSSRFGTDGLTKLVEKTLNVKEPTFFLGNDLTCEDVILGYCLDLSEGRTSAELGITDAVSLAGDGSIQLTVTVSPDNSSIQLPV